MIVPVELFLKLRNVSDKNCRENSTHTFYVPQLSSLILESMVNDSMGHALAPLYN
jgi:hypothetical protein